MGGAGGRDELGGWAGLGGHPRTPGTIAEGLVQGAGSCRPWATGLGGVGGAGHHRAPRPPAESVVQGAGARRPWAGGAGGRDRGGLVVTPWVGRSRWMGAAGWSPSHSVNYSTGRAARGCRAWVRV